MVTEFTIDRTKWVRGSDQLAYGHSFLLNKQGNKCCLGHYASACGVHKADLMETATPSDLKRSYSVDFPEEMNWLIEMPLSSNSYSSLHSSRLVQFNDRATITEEQRESSIIEEFAAQGITVKFIN